MAACVVWLLAAGVGAAVLLNYEGAAHSTGKASEHWPQATQIELDRKKATLVMFSHPHCPYTRASIGELKRLLARCPERVAAHVLFLKPGDHSETWTHTGLWRTAAAIPGVDVQPDTNGTEARQFGAKTSGCVLFYAPTGQLLFKGGITAGRGHTGDNPGSGAIIALLHGRNPLVSETPVYGCSLVDQSQASPEVTALSPK